MDPTPDLVKQTSATTEAALVWSGPTPLTRFLQLLTTTKENPTNEIVTHFLCVDIRASLTLQLEDEKVLAKIEQAFCDRLNGIAQDTTVRGQEVSLTWKASNTAPSVLYYTASLYAETYVRQLTHKALNAIYSQIFTELGLDKTQWAVTWMITKNLNTELSTGECVTMRWS